MISNGKRKEAAEKEEGAGKKKSSNVDHRGSVTGGEVRAKRWERPGPRLVGKGRLFVASYPSTIVGPGGTLVRAGPEAGPAL